MQLPEHPWQYLPSTTDSETVFRLLEEHGPEVFFRHYALFAEQPPIERVPIQILRAIYPVRPFGEEFSFTLVSLSARFDQNGLRGLEGMEISQEQLVPRLQKQQALLNRAIFHLAPRLSPIWDSIEELYLSWREAQARAIGFRMQVQLVKERQDAEESGE